MIINTTYIDKEKKKIINDISGKPISLWESLFLKHKGSHRMIIDFMSDDFKIHIKTTNSLLYANIEIREKGVIIRVPYNNETISWIIPYHKLNIYNSKTFSIHADGNFLKFRKDKYYKINKEFIRSLINEKTIYSKNFEIL